MANEPNPVGRTLDNHKIPVVRELGSKERPDRKIPTLA